MAQMLIRGIDDSAIEKLKACAVSRGRSLEAELRNVLEAEAARVITADQKFYRALQNTAHGSSLIWAADLTRPETVT